MTEFRLDRAPGTGPRLDEGGLISKPAEIPDPLLSSCYQLFSGPEIEKSQILGPDPFLPRPRDARGCFAKGRSGNPRGGFGAGSRSKAVRSDNPAAAGLDGHCNLKARFCCRFAADAATVDRRRDFSLQPRDYPSARALEVDRSAVDFKLMHHPIRRQHDRPISAR